MTATTKPPAGPAPTDEELTDEELTQGLLQVVAELDALESSVVEQLTASPSPAAFLAWARATLPDVAPALFETSNEPHDKVACWLARKLWNVMPVEANGFEPVPMPDPEPDAPCPCASGRAFEACCRDFSLDIPIYPNSLWPALVESRPTSHWLRLAKAGALPDIGMMYVAQWFDLSGEWQHVVDLLAPRVAAGGLAPVHCLETMEWLGISYRELDRPRDEESMLRRFAANEDASVRCVANRRLATILHAEGHYDRAWRHFRTAADATPDEPETALQELVLLTDEGRHDEAEDRAADWCAHLLETGTEVDDPMFVVISDFENDAKYGREEYFRWFLPAPWDELVAWIDGADSRPTPTPAWRPMKDTDDDDLLRGAHVPETSARIERLETQWQSLGNGSLDVDEDPAELDARVLWLLEHDDALDSFVVLSDLAEYLDEREDLLGGPDNRWYEAIVLRGADMLESAWPDDRDGTVPWVVGDNRPALGLLADTIDLLDEGDDRFEDLMALYLRLNPPDNHGYRKELINLLLQAGRDPEALELGGRYPDDMFAETRYGVGLALYRLGRETEAVEAMDSAVEDLPRVLQYLLRNRIEQPAADEHGLLIGDEFQAWLYREDMRATWLAEPGMRDWLKQFVARGQAALRRDRARRRR